MANKPELGLVTLLNQLKQELLASSQEPDLFYIEEVNLEVNFYISGDIQSGFNFGVVTLGSEVSENRVQKINLKLSPIFSKSELRKKLPTEQLQQIAEESTNSLFKGPRRAK